MRQATVAASEGDRRAKEQRTQKLLALAKRGDAGARSRLIEDNLPLVGSVASRFTGRGKDIEDLYQVGSIGLIKAIDRFDDTFGVCFSTYAVPMITGEIRRFLRDDNSLKVSRSLQEASLRVAAARQKLAGELGREAKIDELVKETELDKEKIMAVLELKSPPLSLDDEQIDPADARQSCDKAWEKLFIKEALDALPEQQRAVMLLRFFGDKTQMETASQLGISQAQVSRLEKRALLAIRQEL